MSGAVFFAGAFPAYAGGTIGGRQRRPMPMASIREWPDASEHYPRNRRHRYPPNSGGASAPQVVEAVASERSARLRTFWGERPTVEDTANPRRRGCSYTPSEA